MSNDDRSTPIDVEAPTEYELLAAGQVETNARVRDIDIKLDRVVDLQKRHFELYQAELEAKKVRDEELARVRRRQDMQDATSFVMPFTALVFATIALVAVVILIVRIESRLEALGLPTSTVISR